METEHQKRQRKAREEKVRRKTERARILAEEAEAKHRASFQVTVQLTEQQIVELLVENGILPEDTEQLFCITPAEGSWRFFAMRHYSSLNYE